MEDGKWKMENGSNSTYFENLILKSSRHILLLKSLIPIHWYEHKLIFLK